MNASITFRFVGYLGNNEDAVSRLIKAGCYGFWAVHTEARMPDGTLLGAHIDGGVQARAPGYDAGGFDHDEFVTIPVEQPAADAFHAFLIAQLNKPYDLEVINALAMGALLGERDWRQPDHWICSELMAAAAEASAWCGRLATDVNHVTPRDWRIILSAKGY